MLRRHKSNIFLIIDTAYVDNISPEEKELYIQGRNPQYWDSLKPSSKDYSLLSQYPSYI